MQKFVTLAGAAVLAMTTGTAQAQGFVNGGFEYGTTSGWETGGGSRTGQANPLNPANFFGSPTTRSAVINSSYVDPNLGSLLGSTVYSGNFGYRVEDTVSGGFASAIRQTVTNYTDSNIFFAWKAVLENGGHVASQSATMVITLRDLTTNTDVIRREYNAGAGGGGVDTRFSQQGNLFYTPNWQIEQLSIDSSLLGHDFLLTVLGADCQPAGHEGYLYLDGFGAVAPSGAVPEPTTWAMMIGGMGAIAGSLRRRRRLTPALA